MIDSSGGAPYCLSLLHRYQGGDLPVGQIPPHSGDGGLQTAAQLGRGSIQVRKTAPLYLRSFQEVLFNRAEWLAGWLAVWLQEEGRRKNLLPVALMAVFH